MKKGRKIRLIILLAVLIAFLCSLAFYLTVSARLMAQADLDVACIRHICDFGSWTDPQNYTDGYEWIILRVSGDFVPPDSWTQQPATLAEINPPAEAHSRHYFAASFSENEFLPDTFTAWLYIPHDDADPFEDREWFAAVYDANTHTLGLYRGHSLWGF